MPNPPAERMTSRHRVPLAIGIVVISIVLPVVVAGWSVLAALRDKGVAGIPSRRVRHYHGSVKNGELWHAEVRLSSNFNAPPAESRILCLDLKTGTERDTGLVVPGESGTPLWLGGTLYFRTQTAVFRQLENRFVKLAALPRSSWSLFLWEDQLTAIMSTDAGGHRLVHLTEGEWIGGRPILLPATNRVWNDDQQRGRKVLLPSTSQQPTSTARPPASASIMVSQAGNQHHVMISDYRHFSAYRTGFEFADEPCDGASAQAAENAPREVSGWEAICPTQDTAEDKWVHLASSGDGLLFTSWGGRYENVARRRTDGTWERLEYQGGNEQGGKVERCLCDPANATDYTIWTDEDWGSAEVRRIDGNFLRLPHLVIPGCEREYLARWKRLGVSLLAALFLHAVLLIGGTTWLTRGVVRPEYEFGNRRAALAPLWRRAIATGVDLALMMTLVICAERFLVLGLGIPRNSPDEVARAHSLFEIEQALHGLFSGNLRAVGGVSSPTPVTSPFTSSPAVSALSLLTLVLICGAKVFWEGRSGITPGKWLLGLRTVRTTLRPCGFARALVRNFLYCVDIPFLETPLPAAISVMFSHTRQRLGDRAADTIVIRVGSNRGAQTS